METTTDRPTIWEVRSRLLSSIDHAESLALHRPEYAAAVSRFVQDVRRIKTELMNNLREDSPPSSLHDIVNGLTGAVAIAEIMAERQPDKGETLTTFVKKLRRAQNELVQHVRPDL